MQLCILLQNISRDWRWNTQNSGDKLQRSGLTDNCQQHEEILRKQLLQVTLLNIIVDVIWAVLMLSTIVD